MNSYLKLSYNELLFIFLTHQFVVNLGLIYQYTADFKTILVKKISSNLTIPLVNSNNIIIL